MMNQAIFDRLFIHPNETIEHQYTKPFAIILGEDIERKATERRLGQAESKAIDEAWAQLSAKWTIEAAAQGLALETNDPRLHAGVGGLNMMQLVGAEGLEPPTTSM